MEAAMRPLTFSLAALFLLGISPAAASLLAPGPASADSTWTQHLQAGRVALARDDRAAAWHHLLAVDSLVGGHTGVKSALATLAAREGRRDESLRWLRALAETGITRSIGNDSTFARWREDPDFRAVAAKLDSNAKPITNAARTHSLGDASLLAEDIVWDAQGGRFLVSSIHRRKIIAIDGSGRVTDFTTAGADGAWGVYGLALDARRGRLWATTVAGAESDSFAPADSGRTSLLAYDVRSARLQQRIELPRTSERQVLGDLTLASDGMVYVSESLGGALYRLPPGATALEQLVPPGTFRSPQGMALAADGKRLYVADYSRGIGVVELARRSTTWLAKPYSLSPAGCDGLYRDGDRLIVVQNGTTPRRVLELRLDEAGTAITRWRVLEQASADLGEPNHGVVVGRDFHFIGNSGWERVGEAGRLETRAESSPAVLLRLRLGN
jgi:sugar lactone lactonase YvrE